MDGTPDLADEAPQAEESPEVANGALRLRGRRFLLDLYKALRSVKLYPIENTQVRQALSELTVSAAEIVSLDGRLEVRVGGELLYLNDTRLRLDLDNFATFGYVVSTLSDCGVGVLRLTEKATNTEWKLLISHLLSFPESEPTEEGVYGLQSLLLGRGVHNITIGPPVEGQVEFADELQKKRAAKRTYQHSVAVTKELFSTARMGRATQVKQIKRAVQSIVDQILNNEVSLVGLTTLRDYDDYTFTHSVNVCIFSVSIGRRLGLSKRQLFDLGLAALLHDVGKSRIPVEILTKEGKFTAEEWRQMKCHTWLGALKIFSFRDYGEIPLRSMITAHEHHMKIDLSGYPRSIRPRQISVFSKIISVADAFDAATSEQSHSPAKSPDAILREISEDPGLGFDPVLVKALINLLGVYPAGSLVILDTFDLAVVIAPNPDAAFIHRPIVRIISDADGLWLEGVVQVNLAKTNADGSFERSIIKVTDPEKYGVTVSDFLV